MELLHGVAWGPEQGVCPIQPSDVALEGVPALSDDAGCFCVRLHFPDAWQRVSASYWWRAADALDADA